MNVKICGITNEADAKMVISAGADAIGVIVDVPVDTPRKITLEQASEIRASLTDMSHAFIAVIMPQTIDEALKVCDALEPTGVQLHGNESAQFLAELKDRIDCPIIKTIHISGRADIMYALETAKHADMLLLDTKIGDTVGGTGQTHDYEIDKEIKRQVSKRIMLSGGLNAENVKAAVEAVNPYALDVSSGVESSPGIKDPKKVRAFIEVTRCL